MLSCAYLLNVSSHKRGEICKFFKLKQDNLQQKSMQVQERKHSDVHTLFIFMDSMDSILYCKVIVHALTVFKLYRVREVSH